MPFLDLNGIDVFISSRAIIRDLSLTVEEKELVGIIGANGSGKSTLLNTISGFNDLRKGEIRFQSKILKSKPSHIVDLGIVLVPEGRRLFPYMSVLENLEVGSYTRRAKEKRQESLRRVMDLFPILGSRKKQLAKSLSGGEQQMLAIGRGLMANPQLLMLDEPSLGLAPMMVVSIFSTFAKINQGGMTILLVEQDVKKSLELCTRAYVLESGRITLQGNSQSLLANSHIKRVYLGL